MINKHLTTCLLAVGLLLPVLSPAQTLLNATVRIKARNEPLKKVLDQLSKDGHFSFSYNSDLVNTDRTITLTLENIRLSQALDILLDNRYDYQEEPPYVILQPKSIYGRPPYPRKVKAKAPKMLKDTLKPKNRHDDPNLETYKSAMRQVVDELVARHIVSDKANLSWFGLDHQQFVVNGQTQPDSLRALFQQKFLEPGGPGYYYGPVQITGTGIFFQRTDLYPEP
jgi:hypothetical protein